MVSLLFHILLPILAFDAFSCQDSSIKCQVCFGILLEDCGLVLLYINALLLYPSLHIMMHH